MNEQTSHPTSRLLRTRLLMPRLPEKEIRRPRLVNRLAAGLSRKLIVVAAPAGFGKTTALGQWLVESEVDVGWVSLDERDNDPTRFWAYAVTAVQTVHPDAGATALSMLQAPHPPPLETIMTVFLNDLVAVPSDFVLVLDDYHVIQHAEIHDGVAFMLENLPPAAHLAIVSRTAPPLPLPLWRARRQLVELDADDLRFTGDEAADFLNSAMELNLSVEQIASLEAATEGWVAGLQLAALSMEGQKDLESFVQAFSGSHRYVFDYLAQEILDRQPEAIQRFLMETAILERLNAQLCGALVAEEDTELPGAQAVLERLEVTKLFIVPLDDERSWYRYHNLFAEFLRARLYQSAEPHEITDLHRRAADWYAAHDVVEPALHHYLAAEDYEVVAGLLVRHQEDFFARSMLVSLTGWIEALPDEVLEHHLRLMTIYAWATLATGHLEKTETTLERIEAALGATTENLISEPASLPPEQRNALLEIAIIRTATGMAFFDLSKVQFIAERLLPYLPEEDVRCLHNTTGELRPVLLLNVALAYEFSGNIAAAVPAFAEALKTGLRQGNMHTVPLALGHLGQLQATRGRLHEALQMYQDALQRADEMGPVPSPLAGNAYAGLGQLFYEWNELEKAEETLRRAIALGKPWNSWESLVPAYMGLARIHRVSRRWDAAARMLGELETVCRQAHMDMLLSAVELARVELKADRGDLDAARAWAAEQDLSAEHEPTPLEEGEALTRVRVLLALEDYSRATRLLQRWLPSMEAGGRWGRVLQALVLEALALEGQGKHEDALTALERAVALAQGEGYVRVFVDEGPAMHMLILQLERERGPTPYAASLLVAFEAEPQLEGEVQRRTAEATSPGRPPHGEVQPLIEPLTDREFDVLRELARGLTNREIAEQLTVSLNTIKTHTRNIYAKLEVRNRTEAVVRAQELGLLEG